MDARDSGAKATSPDARKSDVRRSMSNSMRPRHTSQSRLSQSPLPDRTPPSASASLPPLNTTAAGVRRSGSQRVPSLSGKRLSTMSTASQRSRPPSTLYLAVHAGLEYSLVRDFAYATSHPMHYGPPPEDPSGLSTPASEFQRRLSDPPPSSLWSSAASSSRALRASQEPVSADAALGTGPQLPATSYIEGPPYSEDDDLHSPIVTSSRHKKTRSMAVDYDYGRRRGESNTSRGRRTSYAGVNSDGGQVFYVDHPGEGLADGPGGEYIDYPPDDYDWQRRSGQRGRAEYSGADDSPSPDEADDVEGDSRYSRDYSFTIASPDEEMNGRAVALFDFARENENELPLIEGQVLWVSYRHGQGWLVAEDPRSGESGLVPEEYVRLVRDIEGGLHGLNGQLAESSDADSPEAETPTSATRPKLHSYSSSGSNGSKYPPVVSHFSTSSRDLHPYPIHRLESQTGTPTATQAETPFRRASGETSTHDASDVDRDKEASSTQPQARCQRSESTRGVAV